MRSIQRLPAVTQDCAWIASQYVKWLPSFFFAIIKVKTHPEKHRIEFYLTFFHKPLLILEHVKEGFEIPREKFHIVGGILSKTTNTGWLEFRQIDHKKYTLASIHEFVPRLPWLLYIYTQALLHKFTMVMFGRYLSKASTQKTK